MVLPSFLQPHDYEVVPGTLRQQGRKAGSPGSPEVGDFLQEEAPSFPKSSGKPIENAPWPEVGQMPLCSCWKGICPGGEDNRG